MDAKVILTAKLDAVGNTGGCNFCTRHLDTIWELRSRDENRHLSVRICPECLKELKEATK